MFQKPFLAEQTSPWLYFEVEGRWPVTSDEIGVIKIRGAEQLFCMIVQDPIDPRLQRLRQFAFCRRKNRRNDQEKRRQQRE
jgi:hypothetical protein